MVVIVMQHLENVYRFMTSPPATRSVSCALGMWNDLFSSSQVVKPVLSAGVVLARGEGLHSQCCGGISFLGGLQFVWAKNGLRAAAGGAHGFLSSGEFSFVSCLDVFFLVHMLWRMVKTIA